MDLKANSDVDYTATQVAKILGCTPQKVRQLCESRLLNFYRLGQRGLRIPRESLDQFRGLSKC